MRFSTACQQNVTGGEEWIFLPGRPEALSMLASEFRGQPARDQGNEGTREHGPDRVFEMRRSHLRFKALELLSLKGRLK